MAKKTLVYYVSLKRIMHMQFFRNNSIFIFTAIIDKYYVELRHTNCIVQYNKIAFSKSNSNLFTTFGQVPLYRKLLQYKSING